MGDEFHSDGVDARQAGQRAVCQLGQLPVVAMRQVMTYFTQRVEDNMEVVEQPLCIGSEPLLPGSGFDNLRVRLDQPPPILRKTRQQRMAGFLARSHRRRRRQSLGVQLQLFQTTELGADRPAVGQAFQEPIGRGGFLLRRNARLYYRGTHRELGPPN